MKIGYRDWDGDYFNITGWHLLVSFILSAVCCILVISVDNDLHELAEANSVLRDKFPFVKLFWLSIVVTFAAFCAIANAVIFYVNLKDAFIGIYNSILKKQTYKFRK